MKKQNLSMWILFLIIAIGINLLLWKTIFEHADDYIDNKVERKINLTRGEK